MHLLKTHYTNLDIPHLPHRLNKYYFGRIAEKCFLESFANLIFKLIIFFQTYKGIKSICSLTGPTDQYFSKSK